MPAANQTDLRADGDDRLNRPAVRSTAKWPAAVLFAACVAAGAWWWLSRTPPAAPAPPAATAPAAPAAAASGPAFPLAASDESPITAAGVKAALVDLLGARAVADFVELQDFPRRLVATIDNLGRAHAPSAVWPVRPTAGRFTVAQDEQGHDVIAPANASRYAPLVALAGKIDERQAAALYRRMYPLLEQAYKELGFGERYLNDRVVAVIDSLLAAPEPAGPVQVTHVDVKGPEALTRPWVRYEFADPSLQGLPAGQKIMVRVGLDNERALKRKLSALREELVRTSVTPPAPR